MEIPEFVDLAEENQTKPIEFEMQEIKLLEKVKHICYRETKHFHSAKEQEYYEARFVRVAAEVIALKLVQDGFVNTIRQRVGRHMDEDLWEYDFRLDVLEPVADFNANWFNAQGKLKQMEALIDDHRNHIARLEMMSLLPNNPLVEEEKLKLARSLEHYNEYKRSLRPHYLEERTDDENSD